MENINNFDEPEHSRRHAPLREEAWQQAGIVGREDVMGEIDLDQPGSDAQFSRRAKLTRTFGNILYSPRVRWFVVGLVGVLIIALLLSQFRVIFPQTSAQTLPSTHSQGYDGPVFTNVAVSQNVAYVETPTGKLVAHQADTGKFLWSRQLPTLDYSQLIGTASALYTIVDSNSQHSIVAYRASDGMLLWQKALNDPSPFISLMAQDGVLLANTWNGMVYVFDLSTGKLLWHYATNQHMALNSFASVDSGVVSLLVNDSASTVHILRAHTGTEIMHYASMGSPDWASFIAQGVVYSHVRDNTVQAYRLRDGVVLWHKRFAALDFWSWSFLNGSIYINNDGLLSALRSSDGKQLWQQTIAENDTLWTNGQVANIYLMTAHEGIIALQASDGKGLWHKDVGPMRYAPMLASGIIYFGHSDQALEAWSGINGSTLWQYKAPASILWYPQIVNGHMYVQQANGLLSVLNISNGHLIWKYQV